MKKALLLLILLVSVSAFSQSINDYQYVIVPAKFDFLKENDKYRLNTLTKLLLQKYGFKSYLNTEEMPEAVADRRCSVLYASLEKDNNLFVTKVKVVLKDCKEKVVYETDFGSSREKEYAVAYNQALRAAFQSFDKLNYKYTGKEEVVATTPAVPETPTPESPSPNADSNPEVFFFAQPITNGFQIVNSEPRVIMRLFNTSQKNVFIGVKGDTNGVVILKNNQWFFEYYESGKLVSELLKLKF
ncbi:hypothetical protein [Flavobacterium phycosphaerae]|uniref:hypothetical protein n=1 Tax=Flavobacterium phycosphaerae TaxID=2697515 RepID=UPI001389AA3F|nr:hypothetical protein [Flavobacterium phycosphaerae]